MVSATRNAVFAAASHIALWKVLMIGRKRSPTILSLRTRSSICAANSAFAGEPSSSFDSKSRSSWSFWLGVFQRCAATPMSFWTTTNVPPMTLPTIATVIVVSTQLTLGPYASAPGWHAVTSFARCIRLPRVGRLGMFRRVAGDLHWKCVRTNLASSCRRPPSAPVPAQETPYGEPTDEVQTRIGPKLVPNDPWGHPPKPPLTCVGLTGFEPATT